MSKNNDQSLPPLIEAVHEELNASRLLKSMGFSVVRRELIDATDLLEAGCRFVLESTSSRAIAVTFSPVSEDDGYFVVLIRNTETIDSFLLKDLLKIQGAVLQPSPFTLRHYPGTTFHDRLANFMFFFEGKLCKEIIASVLRGETWLDVPFDLDGLG